MSTESNIKNDGRRLLLEEKLYQIRENIQNHNKQFTLMRFLFFLCLGVLSAILMFLGQGDDLGSIFYDKESFMLLCLIALVIGLVLFLTIPFSMKLANKMQEKVIMAELAIIGSEILQENIQEDFFTNLVKINFKYIDKYYLQTQIQADKSFNVALAVAIVAFLFIVWGIFLMERGDGEEVTSYIVTGTGVISEFIAAIFFYLYNQTIIKMGEYHQKLVLTQNISLALKITEQMRDEDKSKSQSYIIEQLTKDINQHLVSRLDVK